MLLTLRTPPTRIKRHPCRVPNGRSVRFSEKAIGAVVTTEVVDIKDVDTHDTPPLVARS